MTRRVYLDHNATSPVRACAREAMNRALDAGGNASSVHEEGRKARAVIEKAREQVAALVNASSKNVIFTSGGTESNNTALSPALLLANGRDKSFVGTLEEIFCFISEIEHPSVLSGGRFPEGQLRRLPVSGEGVVVLDALRKALEHFREEQPEAPFLVSVMAANNETGAVQPISEAAGLVHTFGGLMHVDAVQAAGKTPLDCETLGVDMLTLSSHKIGGPQGVGALVFGKTDLLIGQPLLKGGGQELYRRAGTENVAGIAGFGAAAEDVMNSMGEMKSLARLRDKMEQELLTVAPEIRIFSNNIERLPNTSCFGVAGLTAETLLIALDLKGVSVSSGAACSSGKVESSHVLEAMGVHEELKKCAIRVSLGWSNTEQDIDRFTEVWISLYRKFKTGREAA